MFECVQNYLLHCPANDLNYGSLFERVLSYIWGRNVFLSLTEYNMISGLLDSFEYHDETVDDILDDLIDPLGNKSPKIIMDYELFATWLRKNVNDEKMERDYLCYVSMLKEYGERYDLSFDHLVDYLYPDENKKLSDELKKLKRNPNEYEYDHYDESYIIKDISGIDELCVSYTDIDELL